MTHHEGEAWGDKTRRPESGLKDELDEGAPALAVQRKAGINKRALAFVGILVALVLLMLVGLFRSAPAKKREETVQRVAAPSRPSLPSDARARAGSAGEWASDDLTDGMQGRGGAGRAGWAGSADAAVGPGRGAGGREGGVGYGGARGAAGSGSAGVGARANDAGLIERQRALYDAETAALEAALQDGPGVIPMARSVGGGGRAGGASRANDALSAMGGHIERDSSDALFNEVAAAAGVSGSAGRAGRAAGASGAARDGTQRQAARRQVADAASRQARLDQRLPPVETADMRESRAQEEMLASQQRLADRLLAAGMPGSSEQRGPESRLPAQRAGDGPSSAQFLSEPDMLLARGTYIRCVLETRIITDLEGFASCVTAEPIYSTNGRRLLIPQGSKVLGSYAAGVGSGHRIAVAWDRVMTPSGIDITMESPSVDTLGGAGHPGQYDAHWTSRVASAFFISLFSDAFKYYGEKYGPKTVTDTGMGGVIVQPFQSNTARTMESVAHEAVQDGLSRPPTITLNQGSVISIYVAKDVDFSGVLPRAATRQRGASR
ncbi:TrbI/VirB10 family protein [Stenotrophomonas maltophilia]|uniref:TrbI/VirB10 family protein n=1 Tax=Stenotrophomonas maltophilia TaxID=40324 RepID=UPI003D7CFBDB